MGSKDVREEKGRVGTGKQGQPSPEPLEAAQVIVEGNGHLADDAPSAPPLRSGCRRISWRWRIFVE